ncbi:MULTISPECIES: RHS repeat-associated core domain-containing protein [unclassified Lysobacter]|nr:MULTISPECIES: RHS repeat-associated core domain-containing protein [unclassified Lysobacter]
MDDGSGNTRYCYDRRGNVARKVQTTNGQVFTLVYGYTLANQLASVTYPSGTRADYTYNALGQPSGVTVTQPGQSPQVLLTSVTYYPFGPAAELEYGDGRRLKRTHNQNYQPGVIEDVGPDGLSLGYEFDAVGNLIKLRKGDQSEPPLRAYAYDKLGRLTETRDGATNALLQGYTYDATGNRTSKTDASVTQTYTYPSTSHRLSQIGATARSYDATGNTTAVGGTAQEYVYTAANRMGQVKQGGNAVMNYAYNGRGEQTRRYPTTTSTSQTYASYDEAGHTVGVYDHTGNRIQEVIWLNDLPIGVIDTNKLHYVQADHLGTPRNVIDPVAEKSVWAWQLGNEAFGDSIPNQDPDNNGTAFVFDLRFPGQRHDTTSGLSYNYFRDYEALTGKYVESDPIGLRGGLSTFGYAHQSPLNAFDPYGLKVIWKGSMMGVSAIEGVGAGFFLFDLVSDCVGGRSARVKVFASSVAAGIGAKLTGTGSSVQMHDWNDVADPQVFNGVFAMISAAIVVGGGGGCSKFTLGNAYSDGFCGGPAYGFDFSAGAYFGASVVISSEIYDCTECRN